MINHKPKEISIKLWVEIFVFISSYYPLFLILFIRDISESAKGSRIQFGFTSWDLYVNFTSILLVFISSAATLIVAPIIRKFTTYKPNTGGIDITVSHCNKVKGDMINFTLPFLMGLFAFDYKTWQSILSLMIFLVFMFAFVHKEQITLLNPMFLLLGVRLYEISYSEIGRPEVFKQTVICLGETKASKQNIRLIENSGINFIYPTK
ncbi:Uncharacterised protein [Aeromonas salmonicida]|uniref:hypothetical protein n=1 Tax=Aeromonas salmonicida TaxID=645 RepID=UPI001025C95D|nr:hypothetical protein [Aeromonas salmonicida]VFB09264.1 Uncharacterised protein [Aeromonas salmonicida]